MRTTRFLQCHRIAGAAAAIVLSAAAFAVVPKQAPKKPAKLTIIFTSDAVGEIRAQKTAKFPFGGYAREATAVSKIRASAGDVVLVECGDFTGAIATGRDKLRVDAAARAMKSIGYDAVVPGDMELRRDVQEMKTFRSAAGAPFLAANLRLASTGKQIFPNPYTVVKTGGGLKVAMIGLIDPALLPKTDAGKPMYVATDPAASLKQIVPKVRSSVDFVVAVVHTTHQRGKSLGKVPGVDAIILAHREAEKPILPKAGSTDVQVPLEKSGACVLVKSHVQRNWSIGRIDLQRGRPASTKLVYLTDAFEESPDIAKIYDDYDVAVRALNEAEQAKIKAQVAERLAQRGLDPARYQKQSPFATAESCKECHKDAYKVWTSSRHAKAFATLEDKKKSGDAACVNCHTTGALARGGFVSAAATPQLKNVQCECCHGPGAAHAAKPAKGYGEVEEDTCRGCHDEKFSPNFDYDSLWKLIAH